ncbi:MAG: sulfite exporter TauE/SafE family protein [Actinobacteria bacterium]|nr:sulfite exporter TauE/SafE family protein [Actinomycetota bacterium]
MDPGPVRDALTVAAGVLTGALSGLFGVGGAVISTPAIRALGLPAALAVGTTLPSIIPGAASGTARYLRERLIDARTVAWAGPPGALASIGGSVLAPRVPGRGHVLMLATAALLAWSSVRMATSRRPPAGDPEAEAETDDLAGPGRSPEEPGRGSPGDVSPGDVSPGGVSPGGVSPGGGSPGDVSPGDVSSGGVSPGGVAAGEASTPVAGRASPAGSPSRAHAPGPVRSAAVHHESSGPVIGGIGVVAGLLSGLLGIGGGVVMVPAFTQMARMPLKRAIATSLACVALFAVPGTLTHGLVNRDIDWRFALLLALGVVPGARLGAALTVRTDDRRLQPIVAGFLGFTALLFAVGELRALV